MNRTVIRLAGGSSDILEQVWEADHCLRIGRLSSLEIYLTDTSLSRVHAEVAPTDDGWVIRDLGSTNGTYLNGERLGRLAVKLNRGDHIQFGHVIVTVVDICAPASMGPGIPAPAFRASRLSSHSWEDLAPAVLETQAGPAEVALLMAHLVQIGRIYKPTDSLESYLNSVLWKAAEVLDAARGAIVFCSPDAADSRVRVDLGQAGEGGQGPGEGEAVLHLALTEGTSLLLQAPTETAESMVCAVLRVHEERIGALYLVRSAGQPSFTERELHLAEALALAAAASLLCFAELQERQKQLSLNTLAVLTQFLQLRDDRIGKHGQRVTDYSLLLAEQLGLSAAEKDDLRLGAPLHEVGKVGIKDSILNKPSRLSPAEMAHVREQIGRGAELVQEMPALLNVQAIVRNTHEHWDGSGYPDGLEGTRIPRLARVVAVADAFDAITVDQPYRRGRTVADALAEIQKSAGTTFDPEVVAALLQLQSRLEDTLEQHGTLTRTMSVRELRAALA